MVRHESFTGRPKGKKSRVARGPQAVRDMKARITAGWTVNMLLDRWHRGDIEYDMDPMGPTTGTSSGGSDVPVDSTPGENRQGGQ